MIRGILKTRRVSERDIDSGRIYRPDIILEMRNIFSQGTLITISSILRLHFWKAEDS
jgi:hypothetical protein